MKKGKNYHDCCYQLIKVDVDKKEVSIRENQQNTIFKKSLLETVLDTKIINGMSAKHAALIGFYARQAVPRIECDNKALCQLQYLDRAGYIGYIDINSQKAHVKWPVDIMQDDTLISQFSATAACYIGFISSLNIGTRIK